MFPSHNYSYVSMIDTSVSREVFNTRPLRLGLYGWELMTPETESLNSLIHTPYAQASISNFT